MGKSDTATCAYCGEQVVTDYKRGRILCKSCGHVKEERFIDPSSEYRYFIENTSMRNDPRRVGNVVNYHLDSQIDLIDIDNGRNTFHNYAHQSAADKQFAIAIRYIKSFCDYLDLRENIVKQTEEIYYEVQQKPDLKGKRLEIIIAACIYLACKRNHVNVQPTALQALVSCSDKKILKVAKVIVKYIPKILVTPAEYAALFCSKLKVPPEIVKEIVQICQEIVKWDFFQKIQPKPRSIAAAVIYFVLLKLDPSKRKSLQEIKDAAAILTDTTVLKYNQLLQQKAHLIDRIINNSVAEEAQKNAEA